MPPSTIAQREILWNVGTPANVISMYLLMVVALLIGAIGVYRHFELWSSGKPDPTRTGRWDKRFDDFFSFGFAQRGVIREKSAAIFHTLIYVGFLVLLFTTTMVFIDNDLGIRIYKGEFYLAVTILSDLFGLGLLIGCLLAAHRRFVKKIDKLHTRLQDWLLLGVLALLIVQGFLLEGLRIRVTDDPWALYSPVGLLVAKFFWALSKEAGALLHYYIWWFHTITVFACAAIFPYSKLFHIFASSANLFFKNNFRPKGALKNPGDLEKLMESAGDDFLVGTATIRDYTWKQLLDLDACTSCGRCQDNCPAYLSGKALSPKWLILDTRNHALALQSADKVVQSRVPAPLRAIDNSLTKNLLLAGSGVNFGNGSEDKVGATAAGEYRSANPLVQNSVLSLGASLDQRISGEVMDPAVFWACTTCMACVEACPVGINHVEQIVENRRNMVLMQGEVPTEAQKTLRAIETRGNPLGAPEDRIKWLEGLNVRVLKPGDEVDYLYWVGCISSFDPRKQKIARSLVTLMNKAGLSFGILGTAEGCSGDPARRLGEENLFQTVAKSTIELLRSVSFKTLVANCPHCFHTIKNEYPDFGDIGNGRSIEIVHHSALLKRLLDEDKLTLKDSDEEFTFHDPCYLGRYNDEYDAPRETLKKAKGLKIIEMERSRERGMCCGAGGGHFWMDLKVGERVNVLRANQAAETGTSTVATACPFCMQMMEDGMKLTNREDQIKVRDIAEVLVEKLDH